MPDTSEVPVGSETQPSNPVETAVSTPAATAKVARKPRGKAKKSAPARKKAPVKKKAAVPVEIKHEIVVAPIQPLVPVKTHVLGIDLGGTKILAAVVTADNKILGRAKRPTPFAASGKVLAQELIGCAEEALKAAGIAFTDLAAIGMGAPGPLNPEDGVLLRTGNLAVKDFHIGEILRKHFNVPVWLDNDVHMGTYGEFKAGVGAKVKNLIGMWVGTGLGGCVIRDNEVVHGANRNAGEIGHVILNAKMRIDDPKRGTLETESSKTGMAAFILRKIKQGKKTSLKKYVKYGDRLKSGDLAKAYEAGDKVAIAAVQHSALYCGIAVANLFNILSPELFIMGGGVVEAMGETYIKLVEKAANKYVYTTELAPIKLAQARLGDDAGVLGAAIYARERLLKKS